MTRTKKEYTKDSLKNSSRVENNIEFLKWLENKISHGYLPPLDLEEMQSFIDKVTNWYLLKFYFSSQEDMQTDPLQRRLTSRESTLYKCDYHIGAETNIDGITVVLIGDRVTNASCYLSVDSTTGEISKTDASLIANAIDIDSDEKVTLEDFYQIIKSNERYDTKDIKRVIDSHKIDLDLRRKLLEMIVISILSSKNYNPTITSQIAGYFVKDMESSVGVKINLDALKNSLKNMKVSVKRTDLKNKILINISKN